MKQNPDFILCDAADSHILMPTGEASLHCNGMITLNEMGVTVWNKLSEEMSFETLLASVLEEYEVSEEQAGTDITAFTEILRKAGAVID